MTTGPPWCPPGLAQNSIMLLGRALVLMNSSASWRPWMEGERPLGGSWGGTQNVGGGRDGNEEWIYDSAPAGSWDEQEKPKGTFQLNIAKFRSWVIAETGTNETLIWGTGVFFFRIGTNNKQDIFSTAIEEALWCCPCTVKMFQFLFLVYFE